MPVVQWFPVHLEAFPKHLSHGKKSLLVHQKCCNVAASLQGITIHHALVQHQLLPWLYVLCRKHPSLLKPSPTKHQFAMVTQSTAAEETESTHKEQINQVIPLIKENHWDSTGQLEINIYLDVIFFDWHSRVSTLSVQFPHGQAELHAHNWMLSTPSKSLILVSVAS